MHIIARAAVYIYDGSAASPIFPAKPGKPTDEAGAYLSAIADRLENSDASRTTCVEPGSAQEELLRRFGYTPFGEAADAQIRPDDLVLGSLPDDPPTPIGRIEDRVRPSGPRRVAPMPSPYLPTRAAAPPEPIASDPPSARTPSFSKEELLRLD